MKICFLNHDVKINTGSGRFCLALTKAVRDVNSDIKFDIVTSDDLLSGGWFLIMLKFFKIRSFLKSFDLIHALDAWPYGFIACLACLGMSNKIIITAIGTGAIQPLYRPIKRSLLIWAYNRATKVVAVSSNTKKEILKVIPNLNIEVINHGVDFKKFQKNLSNNLPLIVSKPYMLSVGTLKKRKGYFYSIKAFCQIAQVFPDLKYVIVGNGPKKESLLLLVNSCQLRDRIFFIDSLTEQDLINLYKSAELFILLSQDDSKDIEGFGLVFLEAAACGLPVIATKGTGAEDAILNNKNGFLVPQKDYNETASMIKNILLDRDLQFEFSKKSVDFARSMDWLFVATKYIDIYENYIYNKF